MRIARVESFSPFTLKVDCKYHVMNRSLFQKSSEDIAVSSPPVLFDIVASSPLRNNWHCNFEPSVTTGIVVSHLVSKWNRSFQTLLWFSARNLLVSRPLYISWHSRFQNPLPLLPVGRPGFRTPQNPHPLPNLRAQVPLRRAVVNLCRMKNYL